jgi:fimbrial chaperone protein
MLSRLRSTRSRTLRLALAVAFGASLVPTGRANAADIVVNPIAVVFARNDRAETIELTNRADTPLRMEARALNWSMQPDGNAPSDATSDLIVYPQLLSIAPHATRRIRIALVAPESPTGEHAYRLELNEIPAFTGVDRRPGMAITFTTRLLMAVYVPPAAEHHSVRLTIASAGAGKLDVSVADDGNVHARIHSIAVSGRNVGGETSFQNALDGATILAGVHRDFAVDLPAQACSRTSSVTVTANVDATQLVQTVALSPHDCAE